MFNGVHRAALGGGVMRRRNFIAFLGGATAAWSYGLRAQTAEQTRRIGMLTTLGADDPERKRGSRYETGKCIARACSGLHEQVIVIMNVLPR
jgi:hypothetical protein